MKRMLIHLCGMVHLNWLQLQCLDPGAWIPYQVLEIDQADFDENTRITIDAMIGS